MRKYRQKNSLHLLCLNTDGNSLVVLRLNADGNTRNVLHPNTDVKLTNCLNTDGNSPDVLRLRVEPQRLQVARRSLLVSTQVRLNQRKIHEYAHTDKRGIKTHRVQNSTTTNTT